MGNSIYPTRREEAAQHLIKQFPPIVKEWIRHHTANALMAIVYYVNRYEQDDQGAAHILDLARTGLTHLVNDINFLTGDERRPAHEVKKKAKRKK